MMWIKPLRWTARATASYNQGRPRIAKLARALFAALFMHNHAPQWAAYAPTMRRCIFLPTP